MQIETFFLPEQITTVINVTLFKDTPPNPLVIFLLTKNNTQNVIFMAAKAK